MDKRVEITQAVNGLIINSYTASGIVATSYDEPTVSSHAVVTAPPSQKPEQELSLEKYIKIYHTTKTAKEIAALYNCSVRTVYRHARNLKLTLKKK